MGLFATDHSNSSKPRSIFERAASYGLWMGLYFTALFLLSVGAIRIGILNIVVLTMALFVPYLIYKQLRRTHIEAHGLETFSAIWMQGILTFACGSIILCLTSYIFMRWCYPSFIHDIFQLALDFYESQSDPASADMAEELRAVVDRRMYPTASTVAIMYLWFGTFSGSVLSMILASIVRLRKVNSNR